MGWRGALQAISYGAMLSVACAAHAPVAKKVHTHKFSTKHMHKPLHVRLKYQLKLEHYFKHQLPHATYEQAIFDVKLVPRFGVLTVSGSINHPLQPERPYAWTYTLKDHPKFSEFSLGNVNSGATLFMGNVNLVNGVRFDRLNAYHPQLVFEYTGQTLPNTQIEIWRGQYLIKMESGSFSKTQIVSLIK